MCKFSGSLPRKRQLTTERVASLSSSFSTLTDPPLFLASPIQSCETEISGRHLTLYALSHPHPHPLITQSCHLGPLRSPQFAGLPSLPLTVLSLRVPVTLAFESCPTNHWVILDKFKFSQSQIPPLFLDGNINYFVGMLWKFNESVWICFVST